MIRFACPGCASTFTVGDEKAGKTGKCPKCKSAFTIPMPDGSASAPASKPVVTLPPPPAANEPVEIAPCPGCGMRLTVTTEYLGADVECPGCKTVFKAARPGSGVVKPASATAPALDAPKSKRRPADEDDEDERPSKAGKSKRRDEDEDERPSKRGKASSRRGGDDEEEDDERPSKRGKAGSRRDDDDEEEERPSKRGKASKRRDEDDEDEDVPPSKRSKTLVKVDDEDDDDVDVRPSKKGKSKRRDDDDEDDDDDRPSKKKTKRKAYDGEPSKRMTAALLAFFAGSIGVHKFYLGYTTAGIIQIVLSFCTLGFGAFVPVVEAIIYFTKTDEDFIEIYQKGEKQWF